MLPLVANVSQHLIETMHRLINRNNAPSNRNNGASSPNIEPSNRNNGQSSPNMMASCNQNIDRTIKSTWIILSLLARAVSLQWSGCSFLMSSKGDTLDPMIRLFFFDVIIDQMTRGFQKVTRLSSTMMVELVWILEWKGMVGIRFWEYENPIIRRYILFRSNKSG